MIFTAYQNVITDSLILVKNHEEEMGQLSFIAMYSTRLIMLSDLYSQIHVMLCSSVLKPVC